jgi:hypothetical protein
VQFSHKHHAGELGIDCRYCHTAVEVSAKAGIPPTATCMNCHAQIWADSPFLEPVRASYRTDESIRWVKVYDDAAWNGGGWGWGYGYGGPWNACCGCCGLSQVKLAGYPVTSITEVTIDGDVLDPSEYRLDHAQMLTRMADADGNAQSWPACQRLDRELGEPGTFGITYAYGAAPPQAGVNAAKALACELARSCVDGECRVPAGVTKVTRQGVQFEQGLVAAYIREGKTALTDLDVFVSAYGGIGRLPRRGLIWSPSMKPYARSYGGGTNGS